MAKLFATKNDLSKKTREEPLSTALARFGALARKAIEEADALDDKDAADLFTEVSRDADKYLWVVDAHRPQ